MRTMQDSPLDPEYLVLENRTEVEALARSLEEAAARVRAYPPQVHEWTVENEDQVADFGMAAPPGYVHVLERRPVTRHFELRWPE